jgi:hypothetical protein
MVVEEVLVHLPSYKRETRSFIRERRFAVFARSPPTIVLS